MIGRMNITPPSWDSYTREMVDGHSATTGQGYAAIQAVGLAGSPDSSARLRLYAGYQHVEANPDDGRGWLELAELHAALGEFPEAETILREMMRIGDMGLFPQVYQEDLEAHLAHTFAAAGQIDNALILLESITDRHDGLPVFHYNYGSFLHAMDRYEDAMQQYAEAIRTLKEGREHVDDVMDVDAILNILIAQRVRAECGEPFDGTRPLELSCLLEEQTE